MDPAVKLLKNASVVLLVIMSVFLVAFGAIAIVESARANGETDYCYTQWYSPNDLPPVVRLYSHRPWRNDEVISMFPKLDEAIRAAESLHCPLQKKP